MTFTPRFISRLAIAASLLCGYIGMVEELPPSQPVKGRGYERRNLRLPLTLQAAIEQKLKQEQESLEYEFKIDKARKEAERKEIEARGIAEFQKIVNRTITPQLLKWKGVEATQEIAKSPNAKVIVIGNGDGDLPIILGGQ